MTLPRAEAIFGQIHEHKRAKKSSKIQKSFFIHQCHGQMNFNIFNKTRV